VALKKFRVVFSPTAQKQIEGLETEDALQVVRDIKGYLETAPFPFGKPRIKKLIGFDLPLYRLRSGDFRAYYRIVAQEVVILVVTHKKESDKILKKLR